MTHPGKDVFLMNHPPHLESTWGSAFIPFCAYTTDLNFSKNTIDLPGINFPLCSSFLPTILEGQLCYKSTLKELSGKGKRNSLMLLLDFNQELSLNASSLDENSKTRPSKKLINYDNEIEGQQGRNAKVHIDSLTPFEGFGEGLFTITDVKRMTATDDFLKMPLKDRKCNVELYEDCKTRRLLEECNCVPWEIPEFQVKTNKKHIMQKILGFAIL